jgi:glutathione-specific gamma-glutamylcyclotransferase
MSAPKPQMALAAELAARAARPVEDLGSSGGAVDMTDEDYELAIQETLAQAPAGDVWLFAYGSLLWNPACEFVESRRAVVQGWHRAFCFRSTRFRGTPDRPGLMMGLDRGGQCRGMIFRLAAEQVRESLGKLFRRELIMKPWVYSPRWLAARTRDGSVQALGFVVNRQHERYVGRLAPEEVARILATASGPRGSCAEYLHNTVAHLEELGIRDRNLWRLQRLVAEQISRGRGGEHQRF